MSRRSALDIALDHPGYPRLVPHMYGLSNPVDWFDRCGLLLRRTLIQSDRPEDVCADLGLTAEFAAYLLDLVTQQATARVGKHFGKSIGGDPMPPLPERECPWLKANDIGRAIYTMAQRRVYTVRKILSVFAAAASSDKQLVICTMSPRHLHVARVFKTFVEDLEIHDLRIGLVAYENIHGVHADLNELGIKLGLHEDTPKRVEMARNSRAGSPTRQAGIEVVRVVASRSVVDQAFFAAMILGAAVEAWRFILPTQTSPPAGVSDQQLTDPMNAVDTVLTIPPASADESIEETQHGAILNGS